MCLGDGDGDGIDDACEDPEACCMPNGDCVMLMGLDCLAMGGIPQGNGTICTVTQACCWPDNTCAMVDPLCCGDLGGTVRPGDCGGREACCDSYGYCYMANRACCLANGDDPQGPGTQCLGDGDGDGKDDACYVPPVGCCWKCDGDQVQCNNGLTQAACPSSWNWVQSAVCGTSSCGEGKCDGVVPTVSGWGLGVLVLVLLTGLTIKFGRRKAHTNTM